MTLQAHYPLTEDSGTTANDHSGNGNNGTVNGATLGATGLLGGTAYSFDGVDDSVTIPTLGSGEYTFACWSNVAAHADLNTQICLLNNRRVQLRTEADGNQYLFQDTSTGWQSITAPSDLGAWTFWAGTWDGATLSLYKNGALATSLAVSTMNTSTGAVNAIGANGDTASAHWDGTIADMRVYDHPLTPAEIQYLYDVAMRGTVYTATKTHDSAVSPDITNATFTLNGNSATVWVVGSPGTASEERVAADLVAGTTDYSLTWGATHTDFALVVQADLADPTTRVEVDKLALRP